jgi:hypothetical protein
LPPIARSVAVAISFIVLSSPPMIQSWVGGDTRPFIVATIALAALQAFLTWSWDRQGATSRGREEHLARVASGFSRTSMIGATSVIAGALVISACTAWLHQIFTIPHDPQRADMLIVVQEGLRRLAQGHNPYTIYRVPWEAPLPYGPVLWGPYAIPMALHADVRFLTVLGELFVPIACGLAAIALSVRGRLIESALCLAMAAAICFNPDFERFASIGHTPSYWPLLALFAWLVVRERWIAAAITLGLLVVGRTTMVAMVPVLAIAVWRRDRPRTAAAIGLLAAAVVLPFLPFAILDAGALRYALYGSYQNVIKGFVWTSTTWVPHTIGLTGVLLTYGLQRYVEVFQLIVMAGVYALAWRAIGRGGAPIAWMGVALFAFSMTTLWPVTYVYFDVLLLLAAAVAAEFLDADAAAPRSLAAWWAATAAVAVVIIVGSTALALPSNPVVDAGDASARPYLRSGFTGDEREGPRSFAWVEGRRASILLPRRSAAAATIELICQPALPPGAAAQRLSATLNGSLIGDAVLTAGWNEVSLAAPARAWRIGVNELELSLSGTTSPADAGVNGDQRQLSVALDRVAVK